MNPQSSSDTAQQRRRRPPLACEQCRRRKVRCDRNLPCTPCRRARQSLACSYAPTNHVSQDITSINIDSPAPTCSQGQPSSKKRSITSVLCGEEGENADNLGASNISSPNTQLIENLQLRVRQLEELVGACGIHPITDAVVTSSTAALEQSTVHHPNPIGQNHSSQSGRPQASESYSITAPLPRLRVSSEKSKLFGANHWINTAAQFQVIGDFTPRDVEFSFANENMADLQNAVRECAGLRRSWKTRLYNENTLPILDISSTFPDRTVCNELVQCYMRTLEPIYRLFHIPSFWEEYEQFWNNLQASPTQFAMKLGLILAIGTIFYGNPENWEHLQGLSQKWIYSAQWWLTGPSGPATFNLDGIQICCLIILSRQVGCLSTPLWISAASLLRMAMMIGLHRNTTLFPTLSPFQVEMRKRLWATVVELSVQSVMDSGVPCALSLDDGDSEGPSNIDDNDISLGSKSQVIPKGNRVLTDSSVQILLGRSLHVRLEIARLINKTSRADLTYDTTLKLGNELRAACREVSAFFQAHSSTRNKHETGVTDFHRRFIDMMLRRYILFLHRPFMIEARKDARYYLSRKICVESCIVMASYTEKLDEASEDSIDLSRLTFAGNISFKGPLCMDVISVLGFEILMQIEEGDSLGTIKTPTSQTGNDILDELATATRAPLLKCLMRIKDQLEQTFTFGIPSLKRYTYAAAILSLIRTMENGLPLKPTIYEDATASLKTCVALLKKYQADRNQTVPIEAAQSDDVENISSLFSLDDWDSSTDLDFSDLLGFPGLFDQPPHSG
ncbi:hypothetical protein BGW36DRAFT_137076 [Talaromyces proteolyticus]|uniref:Zn(2)-C6 fungal-type domain-containing protein n=1 Tax=Talaromyces proteolyticus TaxID=1131652 RepID=A0AAD4KU00_9EURO|nr:uncharacterized protein BGW36DRAFT_137076 [Talaromyces proteolyticus]KAH8700842.1 hypothetical protein BGW36DRAFT_137076 [Talaromyces proteolyticus]